MKLTESVSKRNYYSLLWHAVFLALAANFMDVDVIIPAMIIDAGGSAVHVGIATALLLGGSTITQLLFVPFISNFHFKKKFLLLGINLRIAALLVLGLLLYFSFQLEGRYQLEVIFLLITIFSISGAFAGISYSDIIGKSFFTEARKSFFSLKQVLNGLIVFSGAFLAKYVLALAEYPINYAYLFFIGFISLSIASLGFWNLKEVIPSKLQIKSVGHFSRLIKDEFKQNKKLKYYIGFINSMGISAGLLPFIILYAKDLFDTQSSDTGNYLLFKVLGGVLTGLTLFLLSGKFKYRYLLYFNASFALISPILILIFPQAPPFFLLFFIGGIIFASYGVARSGILLEVTNNSNRSLYAGITGAGTILPVLFPLTGGWVINHFGFNTFFILFLIFILASFYFIYKLDCKK